LVDRHPRPAPDVVHTARNAADAGRVGRRDRIADKGEISSLLTVAVHGDGLAQDRGAQEPVEAHVGPLSWAVDREVAERHRRYAVVDVIQVTQLFSRQLRDAV